MISNGKDRRRPIAVLVCMVVLFDLGCTQDGAGEEKPSSSEPSEPAPSPNDPDRSGGNISLPGDTPCETIDDCPVGSFCSAAAICVPEGGCAAAEDCPSELPVCTSSSLMCVALGGCIEDADCGTGQVCDSATSLCVTGGDCGSSEFEADRLPPKVMLLLDRSGSMVLEDGTNQSRWETAKSALFTVLEQVGASARFGLTSYSACLEGGCAAGVNEVPISEEGANQVDSFLRMRTACSYDEKAAPDDQGELCYLCDSGIPETSTGKSLAALVGEPQLQDPNRDNAVVLLTDGHESDECIEDDVDAAAGAALLLAQEISVPTYVIGFSGDVDEQELDATALAGGTTAPILADDLTALEEAFRAIVRNVLSCEFVLRETPPDPEELYVFLNDEAQPLTRNGPNGWAYDAARQSVVLAGTTCEALKEGQVEDVSIIYGCPERVVR